MHQLRLGGAQFARAHSDRSLLRLWHAWRCLAVFESWLRYTAQDDQRRFEILKSALANRSVLYFGCGAAGFLRKAQSLAAEVASVEPERRTRESWGDSIALYGGLEHVGVSLYYRLPCGREPV